MTMPVIWALAAIVFVILEAATVGLASIWFAIGSVCALILSLLHLPLWLQITVFIVVSLATLALTRPLARRFINSRRQPTNADRFIGVECIVDEAIDNVAGTGSVLVSGRRWTARSHDGSQLAHGDRARVIRIEGVKLIVEPLAAAQPEL